MIVIFRYHVGLIGMAHPVLNVGEEPYFQGQVITGLVREFYTDGKCCILQALCFANVMFYKRCVVPTLCFTDAVFYKRKAVQTPCCRNAISYKRYLLLPLCCSHAILYKRYVVQYIVEFNRR